ncbi:MAG TPA: hypothetical protein VEI82_03940, partial [Myxococcota bacterium]|nr:hypothetical protein [Myxococcota bacterium]
GANADRRRDRCCPIVFETFDTQSRTDAVSGHVKQTSMGGEKSMAARKKGGRKKATRKKGSAKKATRKKGTRRKASRKK